MLSKTGARTAALRCFIYNGRRVVRVEHIAVSGTPHSKLSQLLSNTGACAVRAGWRTLPRSVTRNKDREESCEIRERVAHQVLCVGACVKDKRE